MTKGKRPEGIVFTNADPRYEGKLDDPQGGDATMLMQQVREVMTVNQEMTDKARRISLRDGVKLAQLFRARDFFAFITQCIGRITTPFARAVHAANDTDLQMPQVWRENIEPQSITRNGGSLPQTSKQGVSRDVVRVWRPTTYGVGPSSLR